MGPTDRRNKISYRKAEGRHHGAGFGRLVLKSCEKEVGDSKHLRRGGAGRLQLSCYRHLMKLVAQASINTV
jgi:hypothetical protein